MGRRQKVRLNSSEEPQNRRSPSDAPSELTPRREGANAAAAFAISSDEPKVGTLGGLSAWFLSRRSTLLAAALIAVAAGIVYFNSFQGKFLFDDQILDRG